MVANTAIQWADDTFNPWWGCHHMSRGCDHCYAESDARRYGYDVWDNGRYRTFGDNHWRDPYSFDREAREQGRRRRVSCASMADVFDAPAPDAERQRLWQVIRETEWLDWLLLTKRPNLVPRMLPPDLVGHDRVWIGTSTEDREWYGRRLPQLKDIEAHVRFLSVEPLLEEIPVTAEDLDGIGWVIVGGESGHHHRPMHPDWVRRIRDACLEAGVPFFFKQWGGRDHNAGGRLLDGRVWSQFPPPPVRQRTRVA